VANAIDLTVNCHLYDQNKATFATLQLSVPAIRFRHANAQLHAQTTCSIHKHLHRFTLHSDTSCHAVHVPCHCRWQFRHGQNTHCPGLGLEACRKGKSVGFITAATLVHELPEAKDEKRLLKLQKQLAWFSLLIIDELGYVPLSPTPDWCGIVV
jgi:hypothetical protein